MSKTKQNRKSRTYVEIYQSVRKDWGTVNPVTRVIPDKRRKPPKHKNKSWED